MLPVIQRNPDSLPGHPNRQRKLKSWILVLPVCFLALPFAAPNTLRVGDWAIAIGNALGLPGDFPVAELVAGHDHSHLDWRRAGGLDLGLAHLE